MPSLSKEAALVHEALVARGLETPLRPPVHEMDNETRKRLIAGHMTEIMQLLNLDNRHTHTLSCHYTLRAPSHCRSCR